MSNYMELSDGKLGLTVGKVLSNELFDMSRKQPLNPEQLWYGRRSLLHYKCRFKCTGKIRCINTGPSSLFSMTMR